MIEMDMPKLEVLENDVNVDPAKYLLIDEK